VQGGLKRRGGEGKCDNCVIVTQSGTLLEATDGLRSERRSRMWEENGEISGAQRRGIGVGARRSSAIGDTDKDTWTSGPER